MNIAVKISKKVEESLIREKLSFLTSKLKDVIIQIDSSKGLDKVVMDWALNNKHTVKIFHGDSILERAKILIVFGKDKDVINFSKEAEKKGIKVRRV